MVFVFPRNRSTWWVLLSWEWLNTPWQWEVVNGSFVLFCLHVQLSLYLVNCLYLRPRVLALLPFRFSPPSIPPVKSEWLCGAELPAGAKPQQRHEKLHSTKGRESEIIIFHTKRKTLMQASDFEKSKKFELNKWICIITLKVHIISQRSMVDYLGYAFHCLSDKDRNS